MAQSMESPHTFHIPVLGIGFSVDTPMKVAKYGISSVISLVNDGLIEKARMVHAREYGEPYEPIGDKDEDSRARRITSYMNLLGRIVKRQVEELQASPFEPDSEITRYYEMLPESDLKQKYQEMLAEEDPEKKEELQEELRTLAVPGSIDANIMTKLDVDKYTHGEKESPEYSDALAAFRGFANSDLDHSSMILSAGLNPRLYGYIAKFNDFRPDEQGNFKKKIILKVSDYRSAEVQGKFLATRGVWVSEYRIESGLNCGGHAFPTHGLLLGPILEVFMEKRHELHKKTSTAYLKTMEKEGRAVDFELPPIKITAQGGIGTAEEDKLLMKYYNLDGTGWGTPFLMVPEATNVDSDHLEKLVNAAEGDVRLTENSPSTIPFWSLRTADGETDRDRKIECGDPGSACPNGFLKFDTEFTERPLCIASKGYLRKKLDEISGNNYSATQIKYLTEKILARTCLCRDLGGSFEKKYGLNDDAKPIVCAGPNILNFKKISTLPDMVNHIYGRISVIASADRAHMFINELRIYVDFMKKELKEFSLDLSDRVPKYFTDYKDNLLSGIDYYNKFSEMLEGEARNRFLKELNELKQSLISLYASYFECEPVT